ncbi:hypothetical protein C0989_010254 [Termitomyces sp. Mn162]|nr:hypothetical protein C0989_010254 [Termitomyces sp. Mn162]
MPASAPSSSPPTSPAPAPAAAAARRKPNRRANTAERRATHNAVERQRRETLNGRFLDLAALLPNLSQIRRPSKSSIVNSSIAHIHASRRHRMLASRELRLLKLEADALRRELNDWRERAGIPRIDEPVRGEGFSMILSAELELIVGVPEPDDDDDDDEPLSAGPPAGPAPYDMDVVSPSPSAGPLDDPRMFAHILPRPSANGPTNVPAFDYHQIIQQQQQHAAYLQHTMHEQHVSRQREREMIRERMQWDLYSRDASGGGGGPFPGQWQPGPQQLMIQAQRSLFTPPATSHGLPTPSPTATHASGGSGIAGSPTSASGDEGVPARSESGERSSSGSSSPNYELGVGMAMPMGGQGDYVQRMSVGMGAGDYHPHHGQVPRMGGMMVDMGMLC